MYHQRFKSIDERFAEKYVVQPNGCWEWKAKREYPMFWIGWRHEKAHRYSYQKANGVVLDRSQQVCHSCDNTRCVNPGHLFVSTHLGNMQDKAAKDRVFRPVGLLNGRARLERDTVEEIHRLRSRWKFSQQKLADLFGVGQSTISRVLRGEAWQR